MEREEQKQLQQDTPTVSTQDIVREGWLYKQSRYLKDWRKRWFVLCNQNLFSFKNHKVYTKATEVIDMRSCKTVKSVEEELNRQNAFKLESQGRTYYLQAENYQDKEAWIGALGKAMIKKTVLFDQEMENDYC